jgi:ArsR family transcriptional regulator
MKLNPAELLKLLADGTRLRSLMLLLQEGELCVCELTYAIGEIQPKISRHLASLRNFQVVTVRRAGQWIYYQINPDLPKWAINILNAAFDGMKAEKQFKADLNKLKTMPCRPDNKVCA